MFGAVAALRDIKKRIRFYGEKTNRIGVGVAAVAKGTMGDLGYPEALKSNGTYFTLLPLLSDACCPASIGSRPSNLHARGFFFLFQLPP